MSFRFSTDKKDLAKTVYEADQERGGGNCLFLLARGWGIDLQERKKLQIPGGVPGGGMVTSKIEPCIIRRQKTTYVLVDGWMVIFMKYWVASLQ